jgi:hypothetical protein
VELKTVKVTVYSISVKQECRGLPTNSYLGMSTSEKSHVCHSVNVCWSLWNSLSIHLHINAKMRTVETIPVMGGRGG